MSEHNQKNKRKMTTICKKRLERVRLEDLCNIQKQLGELSFLEPGASRSDLKPYELKCVRDWTNKDVLGMTVFFFVISSYL